MAAGDGLPQDGRGVGEGVTGARPFDAGAGVLAYSGRDEHEGGGGGAAGTRAGDTGAVADQRGGADVGSEAGGCGHDVESDGIDGRAGRVPEYSQYAGAGEGGLRDGEKAEAGLDGRVSRRGVDGAGGTREERGGEDGRVGSSQTCDRHVHGAHGSLDGALLPVRRGGDAGRPNPRRVRGAKVAHLGGGLLQERAGVGAHKRLGVGNV